MPRAKQSCRIVLGVALLVAVPVVAQESGSSKPKETYTGAAVYKTYCSTCHGLSGKGDGPLADHLRIRPPDLTLLARRDNGKWDGSKVSRIVDGRDPVKGHGGADMPVWGDAFKSSREGYDEESVKARIQVLVEYIQGMQEPVDKPRN